MSVLMCKMKEDRTNGGLQRALARVSDRYIVAATERRALGHIRIALTLETGRQRTFFVNVPGLLCQYCEGLHM